MNGRYATSDVLTYVGADGTSVRYCAPRILPFGWQVSGRSTTYVRAEEVHRLDIVAYRTLRNPLLAWRLADANDAMDPFGICETAGRLLQLPDSGM